MHPSAWKENCRKFVSAILNIQVYEGGAMQPFTLPAHFGSSEFSDVRLSLLGRVCRFLFFYYLQSLDHLEGVAHDAALLAPVLEVD